MPQRRSFNSNNIRKFARADRSHLIKYAHIGGGIGSGPFERHQWVHTKFKYPGFKFAPGGLAGRMTKGAFITAKGKYHTPFRKTLEFTLDGI